MIHRRTGRVGMLGGAPGWALGAVLVVALGACGGSTRPCMQMGAPGPLADGADRFELSIYGGDARCDGAMVASPAPAPISTRNFRRDENIQVSVPSGRHVILLAAFKDGEALPIASACREDTFASGDEVCLDLTLITPPDYAVPDLVPPCVGQGCACDDVTLPCQDKTYHYCSPDKKCVACLPTPDQCRLGQYCNDKYSCESGCKGDNDCAQAAPDGGTPDGGTSDLPKTRCDPTRHQCVECVKSTDCPMDEVCIGGDCAVGCDLAAGKMCPAGLTCCNMACVDTNSNLANCSACGKACTGAETLCCNGKCTNPQVEAANCGGCGATCSTLNATPACSAGLCTWKCDTGFEHCGAGNTGCDTSITTLTNCGGCGNVCDTTSATNATCDGTQCRYSCNPNRGDCVVIPPNTNGCETDLTTTANCGACGVVCNTATSVGTACAAGTCTYTGCAANFADCKNAAPNADGCETDIRTVTNCGACGVACDTARSVGASCSAGVCLYTGCKVGYGDCQMSGANADGCESDLTTITTCGACNKTCDISNATTASCNAGTCSYTCKPGFADCLKTAPDLDGCETTTTTTQNCGGCGNACDATHSVGATCDGTLCLYAGCITGWSDCNQSGANAGGCECEGNGCCGAACLFKHGNGLALQNYFFDCVPLKTYNATQATAAANAWPIAGTINSAMQCGSGSNVSQCISKVTSSMCAVWCYTNTQAGHVRHNIASKTCQCPDATYPMWD